jgi:hypothetical protein
MKPLFWDTEALNLAGKRHSLPFKASEEIRLNFLIKS